MIGYDSQQMITIMFRSCSHITSTDLYVETNETPLDIRRIRLSCEYCVKFMSSDVNPGYSAVFQSDIVVIYDARENATKSLGLRSERHLD